MFSVQQEVGKRACVRRVNHEPHEYRSARALGIDPAPAGPAGRHEWGEGVNMGTRKGGRTRSLVPRTAGPAGSPRQLPQASLRPHPQTSRPASTSSPRSACQIGGPSASADKDRAGWRRGKLACRSRRLSRTVPAQPGQRPVLTPSFVSFCVVRGSLSVFVSRHSSLATRHSGFAAPNSPVFPLFTSYLLPPAAAGSSASIGVNQWLTAPSAEF